LLSGPGAREAASVRWAAASGRGRLVSWAVVHPRQGDGPLAIPAFVELEEGPWLPTGLRLADPADLANLRAGQELSVQFAHPSDSESYPVFTRGAGPGHDSPAAASGAGAATGS